MNKVSIELTIHLYSPYLKDTPVLRDTNGIWQGIQGLHSLISNISLSFPMPSTTLKSEFTDPDSFILIKELPNNDVAQLLIKFDSTYKFSTNTCWQLNSIEFNGICYNDFMSARRAVQWYIWNLFDQDKISA